MKEAFQVKLAIVATTWSSKESPGFQTTQSGYQNVKLRVLYKPIRAFGTGIILLYEPTFPFKFSCSLKSCD